MDELEKVLAHYGVKGMKWGVRRDRSGSSGGSEKTNAHPDAVRVQRAKVKVKKGSIDALSTDELRDLVNRMSLEKQYSTLRPPTTGSRTKKILAETLVSVGKQQASKVVNDQATKQITRLLANASR